VPDVKKAGDHLAACNQVIDPLPPANRARAWKGKARAIWRSHWNPHAEAERPVSGSEDSPETKALPMSKLDQIRALRERDAE